MMVINPIELCDNTGLASMDSSMASKSTDIDVPNLAWSSTFLQPKGNFFEPSGYYVVINCAFIFSTENVFGCFSCIILQFEIFKHSFLNDFHLTFIWVAFKSHRAGSNAQRVSASTTMIPMNIASPFHGLNCIGHVRLTPQTNTYQNSAKILTSSCKCTLYIYILYEEYCKDAPIRHSSLDQCICSAHSFLHNFPLSI